MAGVSACRPQYVWERFFLPSQYLPNPNSSRASSTGRNVHAGICPAVVLCQGLPTTPGAQALPLATLSVGDGNVDKRDVMHGLAGNDDLQGRTGDDLLCGGPGNDTINGGGATTYASAGVVRTASSNARSFTDPDLSCAQAEEPPSTAQVSRYLSAQQRPLLGHPFPARGIGVPHRRPIEERHSPGPRRGYFHVPPDRDPTGAGAL